MSQKHVDIFVKAWVKLSKEDRDAIAEEIDELRKLSTPILERIAMEKFAQYGTTMQVGPVPGGCPTCGR
jgi:hypothetical protein